IGATESLAAFGGAAHVVIARTITAITRTTPNLNASLSGSARSKMPRMIFLLALILLCHKFRCLFRAAQHGQRESVVARAATNLRRIVAIEFGTWRSGRNGGSSGLVTFAYGNLRAQRGCTIS